MKIVKDEKGMILIVTLWILAILTLLAISFSYRMRIEIKLTQFQIDSLRALYLAKAGINYAIATLKKDTNNDEYDSLNEEWAYKKEIIKLEKGKFTFYIEDEERRINLNTATKSMLDKLGLKEDIVCAIIDWRDEDNKITKPDGVEDEYYQSLNRPYHCKNAPFESIEELLLVKGVSSEILYGEDNISQLITVYGKGKININTAPKKVLSTLPGLNDELAQNIINYRAGVDLKEGTEDDKIFKYPTDIIEKDNGTGVYGIGEKEYEQFKNLITTKSNNFRITSVGIKDKVVSKIIAIFNKETDKIIYWKEENG